ncbi:hypothetical protein ACN23B_23545 [Anabaena sp. FACHB-709]|uniref:hypothetical protein n=1 Tax=Nostocaceae TaxID=1162 RepID=UPI001305475F|nr:MULTISPECIES: hypothetical protein [Nostocaceae]MBD2265222.1 hypothetical protein [Anabaena sp. FACHB-709]MBD2274530.1 hypothetical protein [Nostoc sp. PCC 7120 = FACHB-418]MBD2350914.1 hypothetical protein [Trichormus variabilis FACHB-171]
MEQVALGNAHHLMVLVGIAHPTDTEEFYAQVQATPTEIKSDSYSKGRNFATIS